MRSAVDLAGQARVAVESLARLTRGQCGYSDPTQVYLVVGEVSGLAAGLAQVVVQAGAWLEVEALAGRVRHDGGDPDAASEPAAKAVRELHAAARIALASGAVLTAAHESTSHLRTAPGER